MDYGKDSTPSRGLPRINIFNQKLISRLILADTIGLKGPAPARFFGAGKVRTVVLNSFFLTAAHYCILKGLMHYHCLPAAPCARRPI